MLTGLVAMLPPASRGPIRRFGRSGSRGGGGGEERGLRDVVGCAWRSGGRVRAGGRRRRRR